MAHRILDRVSDTATTTGTGSFTVANSPPAGFETLDTVLATGDTFDYLIVNQTVPAEWEQGLGTYSGSHVFARTTVRQSSNSDAAVSFSAGTKEVAIVHPAHRVKNPVLVESVNDGPLAGFRNALINGAFMVAQRNTSFTDSGALNNDDLYTLDRWVLLSNGNDIVDVSRDTADVPTGGLYAAKMLVATVNKKFGLLQIIEQKNCIGLIGNTVTLSFKAKVSNVTRLATCKAVILSWSSTADTVTSDVVSAWNADSATPTWATNWTAENTPADLNLTTSWATYSVSALIDTASTTNIAVFIWSDNETDTDANDTMNIADVQLELGATATPFERRGIGTETALCQRYYEKSYSQGVAPGTAANQHGVDLLYLVMSSATIAQGGKGVSFKATKRTAPTVVGYSYDTGASGKVRDNSAGGADVNVTLAAIGDQGFLWLATAGAAAATLNMQLQWTADAEL